MNAGLLLFALLQAAVGVGLLLRPERMRLPWARPNRVAQAPRETRLAQRGIGLALLVAGAWQAYLALTQGAAASDATVSGPARTFVLVFSALWCLVGAAMALWPARFRALTNPDWANHGELARMSSSLMSYRITGLVLMAMGLIAVLVIFNVGPWDSQ
jgi:hypothetical protein